MSTLDAARDELAARFLRPPRAARMRRAARTSSTLSVESAAGADFTSGEGSVFFEAVDTIALEESRVHAVGIGGKNGGDEPAVVVYVTRKLPLGLLRSRDRVPAMIDGVRTDVVESPMALLASTCSAERRRPVRPLVGGVSVSRTNGPSGTLGAFVRSTRQSDPAGATFLLSNSHVFVAGGGKAAGIEIVQPGSRDDGDQVVATVSRATRLRMSSPIRADAAIARLASSVVIENRVCSIGALTGTTTPSKEMRVQKHGRTSGLTGGRVVATGISVQVADAKGGLLNFINVFRVEGSGAVAEPGDSGSLVIEESTRRVAGLLYAADELGSYFLAHPIDEVFKALEVELKTD